MNSAALRNRALPPRAPLQPILVWIGRDPAEGAIALNEQAEAEKAEKAAAPHRQARGGEGRARGRQGGEAARPMRPRR